MSALSGPELNYIKNRLIPQITWYDQKAIIKQKKYKYWTIISIVLTALIPILSLLTENRCGKIVVILIAILSSASSCILSIINLCEYHNLWIEYRTMCENLKSILHRYFMKNGEFNSVNLRDNLDLLVSSCENYMTKEYMSWTELSHSSKV